MLYTKNDFEKILKVTGIAFKDYLKGMKRLRKEVSRSLKKQLYGKTS